jgi:hypothetical protein
MLAELGDD